MSNVDGYTINEFYAILDENSEPIEWFDTLEEAEERLEELQQSM